MLPDLKQFQVWFVTGSQNLYGTSVFTQVDEHSSQIASAFDQDEHVPVSIIFKPVLKSAMKFLNYVKQQILINHVLVLFFGCIHFHQQKCGLMV